MSILVNLKKRKENVQKLTGSQLESKYDDGIQIDQPVFDEMKHNVLIFSGEHYSKISKKFKDRLRRTDNVPSDQKIRLTKNHLNKIMKLYINNIVSYSPGATILPRTENVHDQIDAELCRNSWEYIREVGNYKKKVRKGVEHFSLIGEVWLKQLFDPNDGKIVGYKPQVDDDGQPVYDAEGQPIDDKESPMYAGKHIDDLVVPYDIFRDKNALTFDESEFIGVRKLVVPEELYRMIKADPTLDAEQKEEKKAMVKKSASAQYTTFNGANAPVSFSEGLALLKEFYFRPSAKYPEGYFYFVCEGEILFEGVLQKDKAGDPIFPLTYTLCDEFEGCPRGFSPIKQGRPIQTEINRAASKIAETQITLGDDKIVTMHGGGLTEGDKMAGIRQLKVLNSIQYQVIPGRSGEQYLAYMNGQIDELYKVMDVMESGQERQNSGDLQQTLYHSLKNKKKFTYYSDKIEMWLKEWCEKDIALAKAYWNPETVVKAVGKNQEINVAEFKNSKDNCYDIKVVPMSDDIESTMGKYLVFRDMLQYGKLDEIAVGKIAGQMPFIDGKAAFSHQTLPETEVKNILLALDRGEMPTISKFDGNERIVEGITQRMREPDFKFLVEENPQVYQNYMEQYRQRDIEIARKVKAQQDANAGIIPTGGPQIKIDMYVADPKNPKRTIRATVDQTSAMWFLERLGEQGSAMEKVDSVDNPQAKLDIMEQAQKLGQNPNAPQEGAGNNMGQNPNGVRNG